MQTKTLQERTTGQKEKLTELAKMASKPHHECGRDMEDPKPKFTDPLNWNKGWGKYGKT